MNRAEDVMGPKVKIPKRAHVQCIPGAADEGGGAVRIAAQEKLSAMGSEMAD